MSVFSVGRLCVKIAGRDAGRKCVVVKSLDNNFVLIDGNVRRKKVNIKHLEAISQTIELSEGASHDDVAKSFEKLGLSVWKTKPKQAKAKPKKQKKVKDKSPKGKKSVDKKEDKKEDKKSKVAEPESESKEVKEESSEVAKESTEAKDGETEKPALEEAVSN